MATSRSFLKTIFLLFYSVVDQLLDDTNVRFGEHLSSEDVMRIKQLMVDFVLKALIPYVESQIHNLTEIHLNGKYCVSSRPSDERHITGWACYDTGHKRLM
ncbi:hypothetical protein M8J77_023753 [Diaphorina citri]|nr:hypothetical protein M8J77_023753 [Diaphorina citri]